MPRGRKASRAPATAKAAEAETEATKQPVAAAAATDRVTRVSPRRKGTPPPSLRRVHPHHSPSPTTPPKLKKTPEKSSVTTAATQLLPDDRQLSPVPRSRQQRNGKITAFFSPAAVKAGDGDDVISEAANSGGFADDIITFATAEELEEEDDVGEDSSSGKENDDWRALSPRVLNLAAAGDAPSEHKDNLSSTASNHSSSSPLQPRRVTRSRTAKAELSTAAATVAAGGYSSVSPTRAARAEGESSGSAPHSPPTPHKINLLEERRGGSTDSTEEASTTATRVISFSDEAAAASGPGEEGSPKVQRAKRDLTRLLQSAAPSEPPSSSAESDPTTGPKNRPNGVPSSTAEVVISKVKTRSADKGDEVSEAPAPAAAKPPGGGSRRKGTSTVKQGGGAAALAAAAAEAASRKVTDFFQIRRSSRKPKTEIKAQQQNEIEAWLEMDDSCNDFALGIGIQHYEGKGRGIEARKKFEKGDFVVEYAGDLMEGSLMAKLKEEAYAADAATGCYMYYFKHGDKQYCIDATAESGRLGRLVNHSCKTPNCQTKVVMVKDVPRLILVAKMDIEPGTELLYDYGDRSKESLQAHPWLAL